jgi:hypothetical protein
LTAAVRRRVPCKRGGGRVLGRRVVERRWWARQDDLGTNGNLVTHGRCGVGQVPGHRGSGHVPVRRGGGSVATVNRWWTGTGPSPRQHFTSALPVQRRPSSAPAAARVSPPPPSAARGRPPPPPVAPPCSLPPHRSTEGLDETSFSFQQTGLTPHTILHYISST